MGDLPPLPAGIYIGYGDPREQMYFAKHMRAYAEQAVRQEREAVLAAILDTWRVRGSVDELSARRCWENALLARSEQGGEG